MTDDNLEENSAESTESRTQRKVEAERLQKVGRTLTELKAEQLQKLDLPIKLREAIDNYQRFPSRGAKKRQLQYIGRVMRDIDSDEVEEQLAVLQGHAASSRFELHQLEQWRDRLLTDADALTAYLAEHDVADRQRLRQLVTKARRSTQNGQALDSPKAKTDSRALFRLLRDDTNSRDGT